MSGAQDLDRAVAEALTYAIGAAAQEQHRPNATLDSVVAAAVAAFHERMPARYLLRATTITQAVRAAARERHHG